MYCDETSPFEQTQSHKLKLRSRRKFTGVSTLRMDKGKLRTKRQSKWKTLPLPENLGQSGFNIPGIEKVLTTSNFCQKFVWICAVIAFYGLCIYQLVDRVTLYFDAPVVLDVTKEKINSVEFPSVVICPPFEKSFLYYKYYQLLSINKNLENDTFEYNKLTLEGLWNEFGINEVDISTEASFSDQQIKNEGIKPNEETQNVHHSKTINKLLPTFMGSCLQTKLVSNLTYRGAWTYVTMKVFRTAEPVQEDITKSVFGDVYDAIFVPHVPHIEPTHELAKVNYRVTKGTEVSLIFQIKQYHYENRKKAPCLDQKASTKCKTECLERKINAIVECRLPFMRNSSLKFCQSLFEGDNAIIAIQKIYREFDDCNCHRPCHETTMSFISDYHKADELSGGCSIFTIRFPDNAVEIVTERFSYTFSCLLSDIGGNLGFCVGLCLFSFVEVGMNTLQLAANWLRKIGQ